MDGSCDDGSFNKGSFDKGSFERSGSVSIASSLSRKRRRSSAAAGGRHGRRTRIWTGGTGVSLWEELLLLRRRRQHGSPLLLPASIDCYKCVIWRLLAAASNPSSPFPTLPALAWERGPVASRQMHASMAWRTRELACCNAPSSASTSRNSLTKAAL